MYTLAGRPNPDTGWGIADESFETLNMLEHYGEETWFKLGDRDLATHILRTSALKETLTDTAGLSVALGVESAVLPMSDDPVSTVLETLKAASSSRSTSCAAGRETRCRDRVASIEDAGPRSMSLRRSPVPTPSSCVRRTRS